MYGIRKSPNFILLRVFLALLTEETVFSLLYIFASFVKNKVPIGTWIYF